MSLFRVKPLQAILSEAETPNGLKRVLGAGDLVMLAIGAVIGAGIFSSIGTAAAGEVLPSGEVVRYGAGPALILSFILLGGVCALAGLCYAAAGILLASTVVTPSVYSGLPYLLASVAAVVLGGNSIGGGMRGSVVATVVGAMFLSYLGQFVLALGFGTAHRNIVQAVIIIASFVLPDLARRWRSVAAAR